MIARMAEHASGTFDVRMTPEQGEPTQIGRLGIAKTYSGDAVGTGAGLMLAAGDFETGYAGYVAHEVAEVAIGERSGSFAMMQVGTVSAGEQSLSYQITPGSGTGDFAGISGRLDLEMRDGAHHYDLVFELPG